MPRLLPALAAAWMAAALVVASATTSSRAAVNAEEEIPTLELKVDDAPVDAMDLSPSAARRLANPTSCAGSTVPACAVRTPRAVLFVLDASNSLNPDDFSGPMLNFIQLTYCAFDSRDSNQAGVVTFANQIKTRVPLAVYTQAQWFAQVETIRTQASSICCFCCTPTAEAFDAAAVEFKRANVPAGTQKVAFVISDGTPYQNNGGTYAWNPRGLNEAVYAYTTVPQRAVALRQLGVRLMFVGVPNKLGRLPATDYFAGIPDPAKGVAGQPSNYQCESRNPPKKFCATMNTPPFPIVSFPIADNLISVGSFDVDSLISGTITSLCKLVPTQGPTARPTTLSPTRKPSRAPSKSPTSNSFDHVDLNFLLDRSGSIVTDASACRKSSAADQSLPDDKVCWHLMLSFVKTLVARTLQLGDKGPIGWMGAGPVTRKGVRVNILGFACTDSQRQPVIVKIAEGASTQAAFDAAITAAESITPFGGTCPGAALQRVVGLRQFSLNRPFAAAILATDGVFYDGNDPKAAAKALAYLGVAKYAFAVGLPLSKYPGGLRPWQLKEQKVQLNDFVDGDQSNLFNLGEDGYNKINEVAVEIAESLPDKYVGAIGQQLQKYPYVCSGYTNKGRCELQGPSAPGSSGLFCFWDAVNTKCKLKQRCDRPKAACGTSITGIPDPCCSWNANSNVCVAAANRPSYCSVAGLLE